MRYTRPLLLATAFVMLAGTACRSANTAEAGEQQPESQYVTLLVTNDNFSDVEIHIMRSGLATRLGRVTSGSTRRFSLGPAIIGPSDVSFVASPVTGGGVASSGPVLVSAGQTVEFRVAPVLSQSAAYVR